MPVPPSVVLLWGCRMLRQSACSPAEGMEGWQRRRKIQTSNAWAECLLILSSLKLIKNKTSVEMWI